MKSNTETPSRDQIAVADTWDLTLIYADEDAWRADLEKTEKESAKIALYRETLSRSVEDFSKTIRFHLDNCRAVEKLYTYAHLLSDTDVGDAHAQGLLQQSMSLYTRYMGMASYIVPEVLAIDEKTLATFLADERVLDIKRLVLDITRYKPHTLSPNEEEIVALGSETYSSCQKVFSQLNNADLQFGSVMVDGEARPLTHSTYITFLEHQDAEVRKTAYKQFYSVFEQHKNTLAALLTGCVQKNVYLSKIKKFSSARERSLFGDNISTDVYDNLVDTVSGHLEVLYRYYDLRKKVLGLDTLSIYDTYVPLVPDVKAQHTYQEACAMVIDSVAPLGVEYQETMRGGLLEKRWVDIYENKGKRSGAYSSGCYDSAPYLLLNFKEDSFNDIFTLAHEAAHSMHSYYSCQNQQYQDNQYTIFVAEVASTFNEQLLMRQLREQFAGDATMISYLINHHIDDIKGTLFRQTMFAEFEKIIHAMAEENQPLTLDSYQDVYRGLLAKYFGPNVKLPAVSSLEFTRIPHFYSSFYVYKYATGISAAITLADGVLNGGDTERDNYLNFLKAGCSKYPLELLQDAGVDMHSAQPITRALEVFEALVNDLEAAIG